MAEAGLIDKQHRRWCCGSANTTCRCAVPVAGHGLQPAGDVLAVDGGCCIAAGLEYNDPRESVGGCVRM